MYTETSCEYFLMWFCFYVPLIVFFFCKKYDDPDEEMEDNWLVGRSFACTHLKMVKIKCSEYETRVHLLAELFRSNGVSSEKIYVRKQSTCESYILFILLPLGVFQCHWVLLLLFWLHGNAILFTWSSFLCIIGVDKLMFSNIYTRPLHRTTVEWR